MGRNEKTEDPPILKSKVFTENMFVRVERMMVPVPHRELDRTIQTEQGQERTVRQLYEDFVLGRLDVRDLGGKVQYDPEDSDQVDPMNNFGMTLEETTRIADEGRAAYKEVKQKQVQVAKKKEQDIQAQLERLRKLEEQKKVEDLQPKN